MEILFVPLVDAAADAASRSRVLRCRCVPASDTERRKARREKLAGAMLDPARPS
ncbi:MAG TPA: hypothetical protein VEC57_09210 [Candidatus Limnocylindrales bacterium]|nr:hypothetical protein [Candidatus Limnocylindrales bacterium]